MLNCAVASTGGANKVVCLVVGLGVSRERIARPRAMHVTLAVSLAWLQGWWAVWQVDVNVLCMYVLAGRARSRNNSRHKLDYQQVLDNLKAKGIAIRVASPKLVMEEAPESYKVGSTTPQNAGCRRLLRLLPDGAVLHSSASRR